MKLANAISVDVEDYFQTEAMSTVAPRTRWDSFPSHIEANTGILFELFARYEVQATFFFMGWVAERFPQVVRRAHELGHEVGCHSYWHHPVFRMSADEFREDTYRARNILQDATGAPVKGYRAPNFSINQSVPWAYSILEDLGFEYDSSVYPIHHELYGNHRAQRFPYLAGAKLMEIPVATWRVFNQNLPVAGGAYLRILPYALIRLGILSINQNENAPAVLYMHPWEIDDSQPRLQASWKSRTRQYTGLAGMKAKLERLLQDFSLASIYEAIYLPLHRRPYAGTPVDDRCRPVSAYRSATNG